MEQLLHYIWKHRLLPLAPLRTDGGMDVEVIDPGLPNPHAGPDFFNSKIRIGPTLWAGNVEIHAKASDWFAHGHHTDPRYDNVILHVAASIDARAQTSRGTFPPQMQLDLPPGFAERYDSLALADGLPPCRQVVGRMPRVAVSAWMGALSAERIDRKAADIARRANASHGSWDDAFFATLARNYGFGVNSEAFEAWAGSFSLAAAGRHRDNIFQIEALFLGQAGLLSEQSMPLRRRGAAMSDAYFVRLKSEYEFLSRKFGLRPIDWQLWRFLRLRPQNFPTLRLAQLAALYVSRQATLSRLVDCSTVEEARSLFRAAVSPYWRTHYVFGLESREQDKRLSERSADLLLINTAVPALLAYGKHKGGEALCRRASDMLESLRPEDNAAVRAWSGAGIDIRNAADSQAIVQLQSRYCDRRDCLRCRFGYEWLKR